MKALVLIAALAGVSHADTIDSIVRDRVQFTLPASLGVAEVFVPASLAKLDVDPDRVAVELPRELRAGRASVKVAIRGRTATYVPVAVAATALVPVAQRALAAGDHVSAADFIVETRALASSAPASVAALPGATATRAIAVGAPITSADVALPPPLARGTQVAIEIHRGAVRIRGIAILENSARPGDHASARLAQTHTIVHGTLAAPATLVIGD